MFDNPIPWIVAGSIAAVVALFAIVTYNRLIASRVEKDNAWSQIDVQLKRRYDLIPNLVETVKGYAKHEQETLESVIQARNAAIAATDRGRQGRRREPAHDGGPRPASPSPRPIPTSRPTRTSSPCRKS